MNGRRPVVLLLAAVGSLPAAAAMPPGLEVDIGVGGVPRAGCYNPVVLRLPAESPLLGGQFTVAAEDPDGQWLTTAPARLTATTAGGSGRQLVKLGRRGGDLRLSLWPPGTGNDDPAAVPAVTATIPLPETLASTQEVLLVIGTLPNAERAARLAARDDGSRARVISLRAGEPAAAGELPVTCGPAGLAYDAIDRAIVCGRRVAAGGLERQLADLDQWVRLGGDLVLLAGMSLPDMVTASPTAAGWLPGRFDRMVPLRRGAAIETYARASRPLDRNLVDTLTMPLFAAEPPLAGVVEVAAGGGAGDPALVVRRAYGFGRITWVGIDLDDRSFQRWPGTDSLLLELLDTGRRSLTAGRAGEVRRGGLDLAGQLRLAVDRYSGVAAIPFELIALIGLLYVAAIYPLDWYLASRDARHGQVAWFSLPLIVAGFTLVIWTTGRQYRTPGRQIRTAGIVDFDQADGLTRGVGWLGIWTAGNERLAVAAEPVPLVEVDPVATAVSWFAAPGESLAGPDALTPHPSLAAAGYRFGPTAARLENVPQAAASSRLFVADWSGQSASKPLQSTLNRTGQGTLRGTIESRLAVSLDDCVLIHGGWLYDIGRLATADVVDLEEGRGPRSLAAALTRRQTVKDRSVAARWDSGSRDVARILEVAGLHAAAGGPGYTGLEAGRLGRLDLSRLLPLRRAILIGRGPAATRWQIEPPPAAAGSDDVTLWRIVLPVAD